MKTMFAKTAGAALIFFGAAATSFGLVAIGIRSAQQQDGLFFAVRDFKRSIIPERPTAVESAKSSTRINGRVAFILAPARSAGTKAKPWIWYTPTLPDLPSDEEQVMFKAFSDAGITVAGIDVGETFGGPEGNLAFDAFYREMTEVRGYAEWPVLLGRSRGGLMALSWAEKNPDKVAAIAGIYPVSNIASYPGIHKAAGAFNLTPEDLAKSLPAVNPIDNLAPLARARIPLYVIHGDSDEIVPIEDNSRLLHYRYTTLGGSMHLDVARGQGHSFNDAFFRSVPLTNFVITHALDAARGRSHATGAH